MNQKTVKGSSLLLTLFTLCLTWIKVFSCKVRVKSRLDPFLTPFSRCMS
jgi:hypothetical protein